MRSRAYGFSIPALAVVAFVCLSGASLYAQSRASNPDAKQIDPIAASGGKPVVLIFLRTDCPISKRYAPTIQQLASKYAGQATFWLVFPSNGDSAEMIDANTNEYGYKIAALRDPKHFLVSRAKATITPEAAVFDSHGELRYHGRIDDLYVSFGHSRRVPTTHDLDDALAAVVAGKPITNAATPAVGCYIADVK
ncbi:MAG: thioredoxin-like domain-containing protein [Burkholderiales bacterium]